MRAGWTVVTLSLLSVAVLKLPLTAIATVLAPPDVSSLTPDEGVIAVIITENDQQKGSNDGYGSAQPGRNPSLERRLADQAQDIGQKLGPPADDENAAAADDTALTFTHSDLVSNSHELPSAERGIFVRVLGVILVPAWSIGLCLGFTGYSLAGLGMNLIRLSHIVLGSNRGRSSRDKLRETRFNREATSARSNLLWFFGYAINGLGGFMNSVGLKYAAQSLMAPMSSVALVSNAIFATVLLGETLRIQQDIGAIVLIFAGNCITVSTGNHSGYRHLTIVEVGSMWRRRSFVIYLHVTTLVVLSLLITYRRIRRSIENNGGKERATPNTVVKLGLCHAAGSCMVGVNSVLMAKSMMLVLSGGASNFLRPGFFMLALCWSFAASFWLYTLNRLLKEYDALFIVPVIEVVWSAMSMIGGGIFFDEYRDLGWKRLAGFAVGVAFNMTGIWLIGHRKGGAKPNKTQV